MLNYRLCVNDPIFNHDINRYSLFIRDNKRKLVQSLFFLTYQELIIYLDIQNLNKSNFKIRRKYLKPTLSRYVLEYQKEINE